MSTDEPQQPQRIRFVKLLLISFGLCAGSFVIEQTLRWSDPLDGFLSGLIMVFVVGINWCVLILPWSLAIWGIYHWRNWQRFRTHWVLAPAVVQALSIVIGLFLSPPTAHGNFRRFAKTEVPADAKNLQYHLWGGGTADYSISYYFECSQESLAKLITGMKMGEGFEITSEYVPNMVHVGRLASPPTIAQWIDGHFYSREDGGWTFYLVADPTKTKVYIWMSCI